MVQDPTQPLVQVEKVSFDLGGGGVQGNRGGGREKDGGNRDGSEEEVEGREGKGKMKDRKQPTYFIPELCE